MDKHLWEVDHPYYMHEGSYYENGCHEEYGNFSGFLAAWGDADIDMNRVHRWDWREDDDPAVSNPNAAGVLTIYFVLQRKARTMSAGIAVTRADEPKVIEYLRPHFEREVAIWGPFRPTPSVQEAAKVGEAALHGLMDRRGIKQVLSEIKHDDPEIWAGIIEEAGHAALCAIAGESE